MMVVMHRTAYPAPGETKLPFGSSIIHEKSVIQMISFNVQSLTEVCPVKTVRFCCSILLVLLRKETFLLHQEMAWNKVT